MANSRESTNWHKLLTVLSYPYTHSTWHSVAPLDEVPPKRCRVDEESAFAKDKPGQSTPPRSRIYHKSCGHLFRTLLVCDNKNRPVGLTTSEGFASWHTPCRFRNDWATTAQNPVWLVPWHPCQPPQSIATPLCNYKSTRHR